MTRIAPLTARIVLPALLILPTARALAQGETGFLRGEGHLDLAFSYSLDTYDRFWIGSDRVQDPAVGRISRTAYSLYAAYGLTDDLDVAGNASYVIAKSSESMFDRNADFQDLVLHAKWRALRERAGPGEASFLLAPGVKLPLSNYENDDVTALGDRQTDYRGRVIGHYQFDNSLFVSVESGYDRRSSRPADEIPLHVTVGYTFFERVTIAPFYSRIYSRGGPDIGEASFPRTREEYERIGLSVYLRLTESIGIAGSLRTTLDGWNTGDVDGFSVGTVLRF
jgi:hypothetical protein